MKDTFYFSHDYNARQDDKIKRLIMKHGFLGYGIFWSIVENLYNNANALRMDCELIAYEMRTTENIIESIINDFDLFVIDGDYFGSLSVERRLNERDKKSKKASESASIRWNKLKEDANALRTECNSNAIKERKGNERKGEEIKEKDRDAAKAATIKRISDFKKSLYPFTIAKGGIYSNDTVKDFFEYWSELNKSETKMRWELQTTFQISKRLVTWLKNEKPKFGEPKQQTNIFRTTD